MVPLLFHFTFISLTLNLGEKIIYCGLKGLFYVGGIPVQLGESNIFGVRAGCGVDAFHAFP